MEMKSLSQRILAVMKDVGYIQKLDRRVNGQYRYVSHDQVMGALRKPMVEQGVISTVTVKSHLQDGNRTEADVEVTFINADNPDDRMSVQAFGYGIDGGDKGPGKAVSYAVKYALLKTFCLETGDDPDNDAVAQHQAKSTTLEQTLTVAQRAAKVKHIGTLIAKLGDRSRTLLREMYPNGTKGLTVEELEKLEIELMKLTERGGNGRLTAQQAA